MGSLKLSNDDVLVVFIDAYYSECLDLVNSRHNYLNKLLKDYLLHIPYMDFSLELCAFLNFCFLQGISRIN